MADECPNMRPVRIRRRMSGWSAIFRVAVYTIPAQLHTLNVELLVDHVLDRPAFDQLGTSHLSKRVNLQPGYVPIEALVHKNNIQFTTGNVIMTVQAFVLFHANTQVCQ
jgi:hypothetical protein